MRIENRVESVAVNVKRFYAPASLFASCPKCGREIERDLAQHPLLGPSFHEALPVRFHCIDWDEDGEEILDCDNKWTEDIVLRLVVEAVPGEDDA